MRSEVFLTTERLVLRWLVPDDAQRLFELDSDAEVRRYVHAGPPDLERIRQDVLPRMLACCDRTRGFGFWAAEAQGDFAGWFHLRPEAEKDHCPELGFRLRRAIWGRGLATEGARSLVERAFARPEVSRIEAVTLVDNAASRRILAKLGFEPREDFLYQPPPTAVLEGAERRPALRYVLERESA